MDMQKYQEEELEKNLSNSNTGIGFPSYKSELNTQKRMLFLFVVFFTIADIEAADNGIKPDHTNVFSTQGNNITLSCTYTGSVWSLYWYRQKPRSRPEFLLLIDETSEIVTKAQPPYPWLSMKLNKISKKVDLLISFAVVSDSALYYCALGPTVTANQTTLYKNTTHDWNRAMLFSQDGAIYIFTLTSSGTCL